VQNLNWISTATPPVLPPWHWKFGLLLSGNVHETVRIYDNGILLATARQDCGALIPH